MQLNRQYRTALGSSHSPNRSHVHLGSQNILHRVWPHCGKKRCKTRLPFISSVRVRGAHRNHALWTLRPVNLSEPRAVGVSSINCFSLLERALTTNYKTSKAPKTESTTKPKALGNCPPAANTHHRFLLSANPLLIDCSSSALFSLVMFLMLSAKCRRTTQSSQPQNVWSTTRERFFRLSL